MPEHALSQQLGAHNCYELISWDLLRLQASRDLRTHLSRDKKQFKNISYSLPITGVIRQTIGTIGAVNADCNSSLTPSKLCNSLLDDETWRLGSSWPTAALHPRSICHGVMKINGLSFCISAIVTRE